MNRLFARVLRLAAIGLILSGTAGVLTAQAPVPGKGPPRDLPPGTLVVLGQLRSWFTASDLNKDGLLSKDELAKAFRGRNARPFDAHIKPRPETPADRGKPVPKPAYTAYPDYQFLMQLDKDGDQKVSRAEFEPWALDYAAQLVRMWDVQSQLLQAEAMMMMQYAPAVRRPPSVPAQQPPRPPATPSSTP